MAIHYKGSLKRNPQTGLKSWYGTTVLQDEITAEQLGELIAKRSTFSKGDSTGVLLMVGEIIAEQLADSRPVRVAGLGSWRPSVHSRPELTEDKVDDDSIIQPATVIYNAGSEIDKAMKNAKYKKEPKP